MSISMLSKEQTCLLTVLSDHLHGRKTDISEEIDTTALHELSVSQQVESIVYYQTRLPSLRSSFASAAYHAVNRRKLLEKLHEAFSAAQIPYLIFKGTEIASYYPRSELRSMGDIDILVHRSDRENAGEVLKRSGFCLEKEPDSEEQEISYRQGSYEIELHHRLLYDSDLNERIYNEFTDKVWEYAETTDGIQYHLEPEFHFVYLLLHLRKHILWSGAGIRQFMDLAAMLKNADADWNKAERYLSELGLRQFSRNCFSLIEKWFGIPSPLKSAPISEAFYESATKTLLSDGVFGCQEEENILKNSIMNTTRKHGKILPMLSILFPPYRQMQEKYPCLGKFPFLLPFMWIRRMAESIFSKRAGNSLSYASKHLMPDKEMKERNEMLKRWGL